MINFILNLLDRIPLRTRFGLSIGSVLKIVYYNKIENGKCMPKCLCGGIIYTRGIPPDGWETICSKCEQIYDED